MNTSTQGKIPEDVLYDSIYIKTNLHYAVRTVAPSRKQGSSYGRKGTKGSWVLLTFSFLIWVLVTHLCPACDDSSSLTFTICALSIYTLHINKTLKKDVCFDHL